MLKIVGKIALVLVLAVNSLSMAAVDLTSIQQQLQQPDNVQGQFVQEKYLRSLAKPLRSEGEFVLMPKTGLLWSLKKPFVSTTRVLPQGIEQWSESNQQWLASGKKMGKKDQISLFLGLLSGQTQALRKDFAVQVTGSQDSWVISLKPSSVIMRQIFSLVEVSGSQGEVQTIVLQEKQGDKTVITFVNSQFNQTLTVFAKNAFAQ